MEIVAELGLEEQNEETMMRLLALFLLAVAASADPGTGAVAGDASAAGEGDFGMKEFCAGEELAFCEGA